MHYLGEGLAVALICILHKKDEKIALLGGMASVGVVKMRNKYILQ